MCKREVERKVNDVCPGCRNLFIQMTELKARLQERGLEDGVETYHIPSEELPVVYAGNFFLPKEFAKALCDMLLAITTPALPVPCDTLHHLPVHQNWYTRGECRLLTAYGAETVRRFFKVLKETLDATYKAGEKDGKDLLLAMARGTVTHDELNAENTAATVCAIHTGQK
jgi:hypothetical protein